MSALSLAFDKLIGRQGSRKALSWRKEGLQVCLTGGCWQGEAGGRLARSRTSYVIRLVCVLWVLGITRSAFSGWSRVGSGGEN